MQFIVDPRQTAFYDPFEHILAPAARKRLEEGWQGIFRDVILEILPVEALAQHFHETLGRSTKELYSMAGLVLLQDFRHWTAQEAADAYMLDLGVHYALNLEPARQAVSSRTVERYRRLFRDEPLAQEIFERVAKTLVEVLELQVDRQRLDSTHVFSDMALFGRTQLMGVALKRFLVQVKRHDRAAYDALPEDLRGCYAPSAGHLFGDTAKDAEARRQLRQKVAEDMYALLERFGADPAHNTRPSYKALERIFNEQCEVVEARVRIRAKTGGRVMQNPSDPDATYDGHKGAGYQVQMTETCHPDNDVQLLTGALPQTAADTDAESYEAVQAQLARHERLPEVLLADAAYGSDANAEAAKAAGVDLVSPVNVSKRDADTLHVDDFVIDPETEAVTACPAGHAPRDSAFDAEAGVTRTHFDPAACASCPRAARCPVTGQERRTYTHTPDQRRRGERYRGEQAPAFRETYAKRAGIEGTIGRVKRGVGLHRLRVRGRPSVFCAIYRKLTGWNILQAGRARRLRALAARRARRQALHAAASGLGASISSCRNRFTRAVRALRTLLRLRRRPRPLRHPTPPQAPSRSSTFVGAIFEGGTAVPPSPCPLPPSGGRGCPWRTGQVGLTSVG